ncbi:MAG: DUF2807 domain-containing protein, partial [Bacteroidota bacterium]
MKKLIAILLTALVPVIAGSQTTQDRQVGEFTALEAGTHVRVVLTQGEPSSVKVEADEKDLANVKTEVKDGKLVITAQKAESDVTVYVTVKTLTSIEASGAAMIKSQNQLQTEKLKISTSGASSIKLDVKATDISANVSGASTLSLSGTAQSLVAEVSGAANLKAFKLEADKVVVGSSGAATSKVFAKQSISAKASGASSISFKGEPAEKSIEVSGSGSVKKVAENETGSLDSSMVKVGNVVIWKDVKECDDTDVNMKGCCNEEDDDDNDRFRHWQGLDLGVNGFLNSQNGTDMPTGYDFLDLNYGRSFTFGLNLIEKDIHIIRDKNYLNIVTGLGFEWNSYSFRNSITLDPNANYIAAFQDSGITYEKNKLRTCFVNVPVLLELNTSNNASKSFHLAGGLTFGYKLGSRTKQEYVVDGYEFEVNKKDDYNLNPFRYSATVRAGYGGFTVFANYALTELFEKNKGPKLYPFSLGIAL